MGNFKKCGTAILTGIALVFGVLSVPIQTMAADANALVADQVTAGKLTAALQVGDFKITATSEKSVDVDENSKTAEDGTAFKQRIKLGGAGSAEFRSIQFSVQNDSDVTAYAMSASGSEDRKLGLYNLDGSLVDEMSAPGASLNMKTFAVKKGEYYLASPKSGVNVYGVTIKASDSKKDQSAKKEEVKEVIQEVKAETKAEVKETAKTEVKKEEVKKEEAKVETKPQVFKAKDGREWTFTYFGQSSNPERNTLKMVDPQTFNFNLNSCTLKEDGVTIDGKGGKFTTFHDGIAYYYTKINPKKENFELTATFKLDYINSTPDGQEGFGLLAMDSLGEHGVTAKNHYTNSAAVIATKFEKTIDGVKQTAKDTLGARFVSGLTPSVLAGGDSAISENGKNESQAFSYAKEDLVQAGKSYTLTLKKTNTGYHASINGGKEFIMYGTDKLMQLDKDNIYVGFAVARGCNVSVSNVTFKTSDPAKDAPAQKAPAELVTYTNKVDSPTTTSEENYQFVYVASVPGTLTLKDASGKAIVTQEKVSKGVDFTKALKLAKGENKFSIEFTPTKGYIPGENQVLESYKTVTTALTVECKAYEGKTLYVAPNGTKEGKGTKAAPLDIYTATQFVKKGQVIELAGGVYDMTAPLVIARGNDGSKSAQKTLKAADGQRAIFNFAKAKGGMSLWGDYWLVEHLDITETPGNIKGLQVAGNYNTISGVNAYKNGDTGIQISGMGSETIEKWPAYNLILNCTAYDNCDPGLNNADGFAAKITVGEGNVFRGCVANNNIDDGWDLFAKIESGPIGVVTIENCVTYRNGTLTNGQGDGDGNGFKLGGDGIAVAHKLVNSISYDNNHAGITSNSNPAVVIENSIAYGNRGANVALYGKGSGERNFVAKNIISINGKEVDNVSEMPSLVSNDNYFWNGTASVNKEGKKKEASIFKSTDVKIVPTRDKNDAIVMNGLLELK